MKNDPLFDSIVEMASRNKSGKPLYPDGSYGRAVEDIYYELRDSKRTIIIELKRTKLGRLLIWLMKLNGWNE